MLPEYVYVNLSSKKLKIYINLWIEGMECLTRSLPFFSGLRALDVCINTYGAVTLKI